MSGDWIPRAEVICARCGGRCCRDAHPPVSSYCHERLIRQGVPPESFEWRGYRAVRADEDGTCIFCAGNRCGIHAIKPETCRAGPFTFDVKGNTIEIFLKNESICPVVRLLKDVPDAFGHQFAIAEKSIACLVAHLTEEELAEVCRIDEPETEKVAEIAREFL